MAATASNASATDQARHHQFKFHLSPECAAELEPIAKHYDALLITLGQVEELQARGDVDGLYIIVGDDPVDATRRLCGAMGYICVHKDWLLKHATPPNNSSSNSNISSTLGLLPNPQPYLLIRDMLGKPLPSQQQRQASSSTQRRQPAQSPPRQQLATDGRTVAWPSSGASRKRPIAVLGSSSTSALAHHAPHPSNSPPRGVQLRSPNQSNAAVTAAAPNTAQSASSPPPLGQRDRLQRKKKRRDGTVMSVTHSSSDNIAAVSAAVSVAAASVGAGPSALIPAYATARQSGPGKSSNASSGAAESAALLREAVKLLKQQKQSEKELLRREKQARLATTNEEERQEEEAPCEEEWTKGDDMIIAKASRLMKANKVRQARRLLDLLDRTEAELDARWAYLEHLKSKGNNKSK